MKNVEYVKIRLEYSPIQIIIHEQYKEYVLVGDYFVDCNDIESIYKKVNEKFEMKKVKLIQISIYKTLNDYEMDRDSSMLQRIPIK